MNGKLHFEDTSDEEMILDTASSCKVKLYSINLRRHYTSALEPHTNAPERLSVQFEIQITHL